MQHLKVSGAVRPLKWSLGVKWLTLHFHLFLGLPNCIFRSPIPTKILPTFLSSPMCVIFLAHLLLDIIILILFLINGQRDLV